MKAFIAVLLLSLTATAKMTPISKTQALKEVAQYFNLNGNTLRSQFRGTDAKYGACTLTAKASKNASGIRDIVVTISHAADNKSLAYAMSLRNSIATTKRDFMGELSYANELQVNKNLREFMVLDIKKENGNEIISITRSHKTYACGGLTQIF